MEREDFFSNLWKKNYGKNYTMKIITYLLLSRLFGIYYCLKKLCCFLVKVFSFTLFCILHKRLFYSTCCLFFCSLQRKQAILVRSWEKELIPTPKQTFIPQTKSFQMQINIWLLFHVTIYLTGFVKTWSTKSDLSVFDHVHCTAIWLKTCPERKKYE